MTIATAHTLSLTIDHDWKRLYAFVRAAENFPRWITFCEAIRRTDDGWVMATDRGSMLLRFVEDNPHGVLDHFVSPASSPDTEIYIPMRVVVNGSGSEILFTIFRAPEMSDEQCAEDIASVERDLRTLKELLEASAS